MKHLKALRFLVLLAVPLLSGCPFSTKPKDDPPPPPIVYKPATSPENLLENLQTAYTNKNIFEYLAIFSGAFTFVFNPDDVEQNPGEIPVSWGIAEEQFAHEQLFDDSEVFAIALTWSPQDREVSEIPQADTKIVINNIRLTVETLDDSGGERTLLAEGDAWFYFIKTGATTDEGDSLWAVWQWEDRTVVTGGL